MIVKQSSENAKIGAGKPGPGRKAGVPNKVTKALKDMILGALDDAGGQAYLATQAKLNPGAFMTLVGKVLPSQVLAEHSGPGGSPIHTTLDVSGLTDAQLEILAAIHR
jgi:hypothetical protein